MIFEGVDEMNVDGANIHCEYILIQHHRSALWIRAIHSHTRCGFLMDPGPA